VFSYHYLKYVSLPRGHQSAVNIADILQQKNANQTSSCTKMLRLVHIMRTTRVTDINLRTICNMHHSPISINQHHGQFTSGWMLTDYLCHGSEVELCWGSDPWLLAGNVWRAIVLPSIGKDGVTVVERRDFHLCENPWFETVMAMHPAEPPYFETLMQQADLIFSFGMGGK
jgi:hypothetical protein